MMPADHRPAGSIAVLVVDDEKNIRTTLQLCLEAVGCKVTAVATGEAALAALASLRHDVAFVDLRLASESGLDVIPRLLGENPSLLVVVITAFATIETAVDATKRGAWDYLPKPFTPTQVRQIVVRAAEQKRLAWRVTDLEEQLASSSVAAEPEPLSAAMQATLATIDRAAAVDAPVLFRGETGTGKSLLARVLHRRSLRRERPFIVVNCPTLSSELLASELFGHVRGAFTGAVRDQPGRVEAAEGGTLFLDEIGEIQPPLQAKLLRFLQDREFERVGENRTRRADVRILAATNRDLEQDVKAGRFREDLLFRLNVVEIAIPPLRERREEILPLARRFLAFFARAMARPLPELTPAAEALLSGYSWPGNVRELRNTIERALILWPAQRVEPAAFPERIAGAVKPCPEPGADCSLEELEREHVLRVVARTRTLDEAAAILGIDVTTLWRKRKKYETLEP